jgi:hypothetical protein
LTSPGIEVARSGSTLTLSGTGETDGASTSEKSNVGTGKAEAGQTVSSAFSVIVLRANQAPVQENAFEVSQGGDAVTLNPVENTLQALTTPGKVMAMFEFSVTNTEGKSLRFLAQLTETGLVIRVNPGAAATVANSQRDLLVGTALLEGQRKKIVGAGQVKSVFIDLR